MRLYTREEIKLIDKDDLYEHISRLSNIKRELSEDIDSEFLKHGNVNPRVVFEKKSKRRQVQSQIEIARSEASRRKGIAKSQQKIFMAFQRVVKKSVPKPVYKKWIEYSNDIMAGEKTLKDVPSYSGDSDYLIDEINNLKRKLESGEAAARKAEAEKEHAEIITRRASEKQKARLDRAKCFERIFMDIFIEKYGDSAFREIESDVRRRIDRED